MVAATSIGLEHANGAGALRRDHQRGGGEGADEESRLWSAFVEAEAPGSFLGAWLALQCRDLPGVRTGLLLAEHSDGTFRPAAIWPNPLANVTYLGEVAERTIAERRGVVHPGARDDDPDAVYVGYPVEIEGRLHAVIVVDVANRAGADLQAMLRRLHWGAGWLEGVFHQRRAEEAGVRVARAAIATDALAVVEEHEGLDGAALALVNELAKKLGCRRVSLGLKTGRRLRLKALSHSATFQKKADLVTGLEGAMEEALDQNGTVSYPATPETERRIAVAHQALAERWRMGAVTTVVLRARNRPVGALTFEREEEGLDAEETEICELVAALTGSTLQAKAESGRWIGGRAATATRRGLKAVLGPDHPALKLALAAGLAGTAALAIAEGDFRVTAKSVLEGAVQRAAVAPFNGFIQQSAVRAGDTVREGDVLAVLEDKDLRLEKLKWESERLKLIQRQRDAHAKHDRPGLGVVAAQLAQAEAELALASERLARTRITTPIEGVVVSGDLSQLLGSPVEQGKVLFEVAPLDGYRIVLQVDEHDIRFLKVGQKGRIALTGNAGAGILPFEVSKITSVATAQDGRNVFRVEASLGETILPVRPGMEGIAKVEVGRESLLWIWTRSLIARARLLVWSWMP